MRIEPLLDMVPKLLDCNVIEFSFPLNEQFLGLTLQQIQLCLNLFLWLYGFHNHVITMVVVMIVVIFILTIDILLLVTFLRLLHSLNNIPFHLFHIL